MCGISGICSSKDIVSNNVFKKMVNIMDHRGPDDKGYFFDNGIKLGHRRLSIIDLKTGREPIHNEDESIWIVFNGEIYNYKNLRKKLIKKGHNFSTESDTDEKDKAIYTTFDKSEETSQKQCLRSKT